MLVGEKENINKELSEGKFKSVEKKLNAIQERSNVNLLSNEENRQQIYSIEEINQLIKTIEQRYSSPNIKKQLNKQTINEIQSLINQNQITAAYERLISIEQDLSSENINPNFYLTQIESEEIKVELNSSLSATVFAPVSDEDYIYLVMPVQLRS